MPEKTKTTNNKEFYSEAIKQASDKGFVEFLKWFNGGENIVSIRNSGYSDFFNQILKEKIFTRTNKVSDQLTALEIGCGGGRILNAACKYFKKCIGSDIHDSFEPLEKFMSLENSNFELIKILENKFDLADNSIDFIYSFIVFQHILKIEVFENYVTEINRLLKANSLSIIYFGRPRLFGKKQFKIKLFNRLALIADKLIYENIYLNLFNNGYLEMPKAPVNHVNLLVTMKKAKQIFRQNSFKILEKGISHKIDNFGTQYYLIIEKIESQP